MGYGAALRVSKNTGMLFSGSVFRMLASFAFVLYVARFLGVAGFGKYSLALNFFELFLSLIATGLALLVTREVAKDASSVARYLAGSTGLLVVLTLVAGGSLLVIGRVGVYAADTQSAIWLGWLALLPASVAVVLEAVFVAFERAELVTFGTVCESVLRVGLGFVALAMGFGLPGLFVALIVARVVLLAVYLVLLVRCGGSLRWRCDWPFFRKMVRDWRVFAVESSVSSVNSSLDVILLSFFFGEVAVGFYAAAAKVLRLGSVVARSFTTAMYPLLARLHEDSKARFGHVAQNCLIYMGALVLPGIIAVVVLAGPIIGLLYSKEYAPAAPILQVLAWGLLLEFVNPFLSHILFARGEQRKSLIVALVKMGVWGTAALWLIRTYGPMGTACSVVLAGAVAFCFYCAMAFPSQAVWRLVRTLGRVAAAAACLTLFLSMLRSVQPVLLVLMSGPVYVGLLFMFRVITAHDLKRLGSFR